MIWRQGQRQGQVREQGTELGQLQRGEQGLGQGLGLGLPMLPVEEKLWKLLEGKSNRWIFCYVISKLQDCYFVFTLKCRSSLDDSMRVVSIIHTFNADNSMILGYRVL